MHVSGCVAAIYLLEVLEQSHEFAIYKKYTWQGASAESAICTACAEGNQAGPRCYCIMFGHYVLRAKIILADFDLAFSTPTTKILLPVKFSN